jgi:hypothetical protein
MNADPQVLRDAAGMLGAAARRVRRLADSIEARGFVDPSPLSVARANIDAALSRLPELPGAVAAAPAAGFSVYVVTFELRSWDRTVEAFEQLEAAQGTVIDFAVEFCGAAEGCDIDTATAAINAHDHKVWIDTVAVGA